MTRLDDLAPSTVTERGKTPRYQSPHGQRRTVLLLLPPVAPGMERDADSAERGVDILAYNWNASRFFGVQVKALSKRTSVPLGTTVDSLLGDFWCIVNMVRSTPPSVFVMLPSEVRDQAERNVEGRQGIVLVGMCCLRAECIPRCVGPDRSRQTP